MKLFVLLFIGIIQFSEEKPTTSSETTTSPSADEESRIVTEFLLTPESDDVAKTISSTGKATNNSSEVDEPSSEIQLPVDLLSDDILLDPSVILARAERSTKNLEVASPSGPFVDSLDVNRFEDDNPPFYFLGYIRVPRSSGDRKIEPDEDWLFRMPEEQDETRKRFSRSAGDQEDYDLLGADDGFIIRPLFKYRHEQLKRSNRRGYRNRDSYAYYPRYPVFPGK